MGEKELKNFVFDWIDWVENKMDLNIDWVEERGWLVCESGLDWVGGRVWVGLCMREWACVCVRVCIFMCL